jgi:hypothetical protein
MDDIVSGGGNDSSLFIFRFTDPLCFEFCQKKNSSKILFIVEENYSHHVLISIAVRKCNSCRFYFPFEL